MKQDGSSKDSGSNKKVANGLVAVSFAAVLAVYSAGYVRTRSAADGFEAQAAERRTAEPAPAQAESQRAESPAEESQRTASEAAPAPRLIASVELPPAPVSTHEPAHETEVTTPNVAGSVASPAPV